MQLKLKAVSEHWSFLRWASVQTELSATRFTNVKVGQFILFRLGRQVKAVLGRLKRVKESGCS